MPGCLIAAPDDRGRASVGRSQAPASDLAWIDCEAEVQPSRRHGDQRDLHAIVVRGNAVARIASQIAPAKRTSKPLGGTKSADVMPRSAYRLSGTK